MSKRIEAEWRMCAETGMTAREAADHMAVEIGAAYAAASRYGLKFARKVRERQAERQRLSVRDAEIIALFNEDKRLVEIGNRYGVTRERIRQIVERAGMQSRLDAVDADMAVHVAAINEQKLTRAAYAKWCKQNGKRRRSDLSLKQRGAVFARIPTFGETFLTPEILARIEAGESVYSVAGGLKEVEQKLSYELGKRGIKSKARSRWIIDRNKRRSLIEDGIALGMNLREIAEHVSRGEGMRPIGACAIHHWARNNGVSLPGQRKEPKRAVVVQHPAPKGIQIKATVKETALANYGKASASEIAAVLGVSRNSIIGHWFRSRHSSQEASQ